jgi:hypothetical protein
MKNLTQMLKERSLLTLPGLATKIALDYSVNELLRRQNNFSEEII